MRSITLCSAGMHSASRRWHQNNRWEEASVPDFILSDVLRDDCARRAPSTTGRTNSSLRIWRSCGRQATSLLPFPRSLVAWD